jgi:hypothetical protein
MDNLGYGVNLMNRIAVLLGLGKQPSSHTAFNPADKSANITLNTFNLNVTVSASSDQGVRTVSSKTTGKFYTECKWVATPTGGDTGFGWATAASTLTSLGVSSPTATICFKSGALWANGSSTGISLGTFAINDFICCAIDLTVSRVWYRKNGGLWNNNASGDPAANVAGIDISGFQTNNVTALFGAACMNNTTDSLTANFGDSLFNQTVPSGFTSGVT